MYPVGWSELLSLICLIWLLIVTFFILKQRSYLKDLFPKSEERDIRGKFKEVITAIQDFEKRSGAVEQEIKKLREEGLVHLSKISLLRYNPYNDTGGDQSFTYVMLDEKLNGLLLTSLHSRAGTRVYAKVITGGNSDLELSKEEKEVLKKAINS